LKTQKTTLVTEPAANPCFAFATCNSMIIGNLETLATAFPCPTAGTGKLN
jgi:hypothetical protein